MDNMAYQIAIWLIPLVFAIVLHEISHGWVANALGDPTAKELGRLTVVAPPANALAIWFLGVADAIA